MRAYPLPHQANEQKLDSLRALYQAYATEYRYHVRRLWADFSANRLELIPPRPVRKGNPDRVLTATYQQIAGDAAATTLLQHQQHLADKIRLVVQKNRLDPITNCTVSTRSSPGCAAPQLTSRAKAPNPSPSPTAPCA